MNKALILCILLHNIFIIQWMILYRFMDASCYLFRCILSSYYTFWIKTKWIIIYDQNICIVEQVNKQHYTLSFLITVVYCEEIL